MAPTESGSEDPRGDILPEAGTDPPPTVKLPDSHGFFAPPARSGELPERIGRYRIVKELGEGGMGVVYRAEQEEPVRRAVALKLIRRGMDTREVVARFQSERQALALMSHSSIARVFDAGTTEGGLPYFVMELVEGSPISSYCPEHRLGLRERLLLFVRVCEAVQHAHQKGIIHRDLKPSNVLVATEDGLPLPKIIDFGIAKALGDRLSDETVETEQGGLVGTLEFMSPEQTGLSDADVDTRTDIYSLGIILYELVTGTLPFDSRQLRRSSLAEILRIICEEEPQKLSARVERLARDATEPGARSEGLSLARRLRGDLDWIALKALEKDRSRRYESASELAADIQRHLHHEPVLAGPPGAAYRLRKFARRNRGRLIAVASLVALSLTFLGWQWAARAVRFSREHRLGIRAVELEDLTGARSHLAVLQASHPGAPAVRELELRVIRLSRDLEIEAALELLKKGDAHGADFTALGQDRRVVLSRWKNLSEDHEPWQPVWEREEEIAAWSELRRLELALPSSYNAAMTEYTKALELAPRDSTARTDVLRAMEDLQIHYWRQAAEEGGVRMASAFFREQIESLGVGTYEEELSGRGRVALKSDPDGAQVYCFRLEEHESHIVPLPFDPARGREDPSAGLLRRPFLRVDRNWDSEASPFVAGDEVIEVNGLEVRGRGDLVRAVERVAENEAIDVEVRRGDERLALSWIPFPANRRDIVPMPRVVDIYKQFDLTFEGYPLDLLEGCRIGPTHAGSSLEVDLPEGDYLLVFKIPGHAETRLPLSVPSDTKDRQVHAVRLLRVEAVPEDFVPVSGGPFQSGGDDGAYASLIGDRRKVDGFLMKRHEVTFAEYLEFLNDPEVSKLIERDTLSTKVGDLRAAWSSPELRDFLQGVQEVSLIPYEPRLGKYIFAFVEERESWDYNVRLRPEYPVMGISMVAAVEYAAWMTRRSGGRWRFRLPTDLEWEKAARGSDARFHVWGNYLILGFCQSQTGIHPRSPRSGIPGVVGSNPIDESIYGIRDLAGSVSEPTRSKPFAALRYFVYRGGSYIASDTRDFRVATRNRRLPEHSLRFLGIRLVAEPPE